MYNVPEVFPILQKYFILENFGGAYTWESLDGVDYFTVQCIHLCMDAVARKSKLDAKQAQFVSAENL